MEPEDSFTSLQRLEIEPYAYPAHYTSPHVLFPLRSILVLFLLRLGRPGGIFS
jgi:hypothetical protein